MSKAEKKEDALLEQWEMARADGMSRKKFAESKGMTRKVLDNKLYRANARKRENEEDIVHQVDQFRDGNYLHLVSNTVRIKSIEHLLQVCKVDLNEWQIDDKYEVGSWEMGRRAEQKKLRWEGGAIVEGEAEDTGRLFIETLYRYRVTLVRKNPEPLRPIIEPVRFPFEKRVAEDRDFKLPGKALLIPDSQTGFRRNYRTNKLIPFHDRRAHDIIIQIANEYDFDEVVYLGDGLDFTEWTDKYVQEPDFYRTTQPALIEYAWFLSQVVNALPDSTHRMVAGNHEDRVKSLMQKHIIAACGLKSTTELELDEPYSINRLLGLSDLGIWIDEDYPNSEIWLSPYMRCTHTDGLSGNPGGTVAKMISKISASTAVGHNHRLEKCSKTVDDIEGLRYVTAASCGCLCHIDYRVPGHAKGQNWQQGFGVAYYKDDSPYIELIPILDGKAIYNGAQYFGKDYSDILSEQTGWDFR